MFPLGRHRPPSRKWWLAGFTLIELVVVIVIIAILLGMIALGYNRFTARAYDTATAENLRGMTKSLVVDLQAREGSTYSLEGIEEVAAKVPPLVATGTPGHLTVTTGAATVSALSVAIDPDDAGKVGLALRSPTGKCVLAKLDGVDATVSKPLDGPTCSGGTAKDAEDLDDPGAPDEDAPGPDGSDGGFTGPLVAPQNVKVVAGSPEYTDAKVTWDAVPGATSYEVYLDGKTDPFATSTTPSVLLEALDEGAHTATVRAVKGTGGTLERGPVSSTQGFTIVYQDNDMIANARKIRPPQLRETVSATANNKNATVESGESGYSSLWWKVTPATTATYAFTLTLSNGQITVLDSADVTKTTAGFIAQATGAGSTEVAAYLEAGKTYWVQAGQRFANGGPFTLKMAPALSNDMLATALTIPPEALTGGATWSSGNDPATGVVFSDRWGTREPGEDGRRTLWWKFTPAVTATYRLTVPGNYYSVRVLNAPDVTKTVNGFLAKAATTTSQERAVGVALTAGTPYWIQVSNDGTNTGTVSWKMSFAQVSNDNLRDAIAIPAASLSTGTTWSSGNDPLTGATFNNDAATVEPGELGLASLWWKVTPTLSGSYKLTVPSGRHQVAVIDSPDPARTANAGDRLAYATGGEVGVSLKAGQTYWIQVAQGTASGYGEYVGPLTWTMALAVSNDLISTAITIPASAVENGATWSSDTDPYTGSLFNDTYATSEPGEVGSKSLWWKFTPTTSATYRLVVPAGLRRITVIDAADVAKTRSGSFIAQATAPSVKQPFGVSLVAGRTYWIQVSNTSYTYGTFTWTMSLGPSNDMVANAAPIPAAALTGGATWSPGTDPQTKAGYNTDAATVEAGENGYNSLWWKLTPATSGTYQVSVPKGYRRVTVIDSQDVSKTAKGFVAQGGSGSTSAATFNVSLEAGKTYWMQYAPTVSTYLGPEMWSLTGP